jgi:GTP pyrophosphokinase
VRDRVHLDAVMRTLKRTPSVMRVERARAGTGQW